jgi:hypothetical protein
MKYATARPYADPEKAARRIFEIADATRLERRIKKDRENNLSQVLCLSHR